MRLFNIVWVPSGHHIGFAVERELENEQNRYKIVYADTPVQTILGGAVCGVDYEVFDLLNRALYESEYHSLAFLQHLKEVFPIKLEEYVVKDNNGIFWDDIRDYKVEDTSRYTLPSIIPPPVVYGPPLLPHRPHPPIGVPWCSTTVVKSS